MVLEFLFNLCMLIAVVCATVVCVVLALTAAVLSVQFLWRKVKDK